MAKTLTDILEMFRNRPAEELRGYLEGYNDACNEIIVEREKNRKDALDKLRKYKSRENSVPSPSHDSRGLNTSSNEEFSKGEDI